MNTLWNARRLSLVAKANRIIGVPPLGQVRTPAVCPNSPVTPNAAAMGGTRMVRWSRRVTALVICAGMALAMWTFTASAEDHPAATQETAAPDYSAFKQSYHLPFGNVKPVDFEKLASLNVRISINGGPPLRFQVDTGSWGVIAGASDVPNIDPKSPPGSITYSSSGIELDGVWTPSTITFPDAKDENGNLAIAMVPVLAVSERKIHAGAVNSGVAKPTKNPKVYMLGIGSGRGDEVHQERNPWVNLKEMQAGTMRRGYTITRDGITLGLTATDARGFMFEKLTEHIAAPTTMPAVKDSPHDWNGSRGWVSIDGVKQENSAMLLDTGLTNMMVSSPNHPDEQKDVPAGSEIKVDLLSGRVSYSFKVGDTENPSAARKVTLLKRPAPMVNTGLRVLAKFDYLYDGDGGYLGLRPVHK